MVKDYDIEDYSEYQFKRSNSIPSASTGLATGGVPQAKKTTYNKNRENRFL